MSGTTACPRLVNFPFLFVWRIESSQVPIHPLRGWKFENFNNRGEGGKEFVEIGLNESVMENIIFLKCIRIYIIDRNEEYFIVFLDIILIDTNY